MHCFVVIDYTSGATLKETMSLRMAAEALVPGTTFGVGWNYREAEAQAVERMTAWLVARAATQKGQRSIAAA